MWNNLCLLIRMISFGSSLFLGLAFCAQGVSADVYQWKLSGGGNYQQTLTFPDPKTACESPPGSFWGGYRYTNSSGVIFHSCLASNGNRIWDAYSIGDSCPAGTDLNYVTGKCEGNPCSEKDGQNQSFSKSGSGNDDYMFISADGKFSAAGQSACIDSCSASTSEQRCIVKASGSYSCRGTAVFDGTQCGTGTDQENLPPAEVPDVVENPDPQTTTETQPCVMSAQPDGSQACTSSELFDKEGQVCGVFNGERVCPTQQPQSDNKQVDTTVTDITNADGSVTTVKQDTETKTVCKATKCTTTTSTKTTTTKTDADGKVTDSNTSCNGPNCAHSGNPDSNGDGFGDGDGEGEGGDCDPSTNPLGCGESSVAGEACTEPVQCTGDAIQCAILRQEKISQCADEEFRDLSDEKVAEAKSKLEQSFSGDEYQPFEYGPENTVDLSTSFDQSGFLSGSCPAFPDWQFSFGDEPVVVPIAQMFAEFCQWWIYFGYLIVAFALYRATGIVLGGMN